MITSSRLSRKEPLSEYVDDFITDTLSRFPWEEFEDKNLEEDGASRLFPRAEQTEAEEDLENLELSIEDLFQMDDPSKAQTSDASASASASSSDSGKKFEELVQIIRGNVMSNKVKTYGEQNGLEKEVERIDYNHAYWKEVEKETNIEIKKLLKRQANLEKAKLWAYRITMVGNITYYVCIPFTVFSIIPGWLSGAIALAASNSDNTTLAALISQMKSFGVEYFILRVCLKEEDISWPEIGAEFGGRAVNGILYEGALSVGTAVVGGIAGVVFASIVSGVGSIVIDAYVNSKKSKVHPIIQEIVDEGLKKKRIQALIEDYKDELRDGDNPIARGLTYIRKVGVKGLKYVYDSKEQVFFTAVYIGAVFSPDIFFKIAREITKDSWLLTSVGSRLSPTSSKSWVPKMVSERISSALMEYRMAQSQTLNKLLVYPIANKITYGTKFAIKQGVKLLPEEYQKKIEKLSNREIKFLNKFLTNIGDVIGVEVQQKVTYGTLFDIGATAGFNRWLVSQRAYDPMIVGLIADKFLYGSSYQACWDALYYAINPSGVREQYSKANVFINSKTGRTFQAQDSAVFINMDKVETKDDGQNVIGNDTLMYINSITGEIELVDNIGEFLNSVNNLTGLTMNDILGKNLEGAIPVFKPEGWSLNGKLFGFIPDKTQLRQALVKYVGSRPPSGGSKDFNFSGVILRTLFGGDDNAKDKFEKSVNNYRQIIINYNNNETLLKEITSIYNQIPFDQLRVRQGAELTTLFGNYEYNCVQIHNELAGILSENSADFSSDEISSLVQSHAKEIESTKLNLDDVLENTIPGWNRENATERDRRKDILESVNKTEEEYRKRIAAMNKTPSPEILRKITNLRTKILGNPLPESDENDNNERVLYGIRDTDIPNNYDEILKTMDENKKNAIKKTVEVLDGLERFGKEIDVAYTEGRLNGGDYTIAKEINDQLIKRGHELIQYVKTSDDPGDDFGTIETELSDIWVKGTDNSARTTNNDPIIDLSSVPGLDNVNKDSMENMGRIFLEDVETGLLNIEQKIVQMKIIEKNSVEGGAERIWAAENLKRLEALKTSLSQALTTKLSVQQIGAIMISIEITFANAIEERADNLETERNKPGTTDWKLDAVHYGLVGSWYGVWGAAYIGTFVATGAAGYAAAVGSAALVAAFSPVVVVAGAAAGVGVLASTSIVTGSYFALGATAVTATPKLIKGHYMGKYVADTLTDFTATNIDYFTQGEWFTSWVLQNDHRMITADRENTVKTFLEHSKWYGGIQQKPSGEPLDPNKYNQGYINFVYNHYFGSGSGGGQPSFDSGGGSGGGQSSFDSGGGSGGGQPISDSGGGSGGGQPISDSGGGGCVIQ